MSLSFLGEEIIHTIQQIPYQDNTEKEFNWQHKIDWERTETD